MYVCDRSSAACKFPSPLHQLRRSRFFSAPSLCRECNEHAGEDLTIVKSYTAYGTRGASWFSHLNT